MHWMSAALLNLIFWQATAAAEAKKPQARDVSNIPQNLRGECGYFREVALEAACQK
jgi:hypothetical protein